MALPHPVQYQGSKRNLASKILEFLPTKIDRLVEPFAGTAAISIAVASKKISQHFWINDLNQPLVKLIESIVERPQEISHFYTEIWNQQHGNSLEHYYKIREQFNITHDPNIFLYVLARCVKGAVRYNAEGIFNQSPDKRRKGTHPKRMRKNIEGVSNLLKNKCKFSSFDYREILGVVRQGDFIYLDPPYQGVCGQRDSRYLSGINFDEFVLALEELNRKGILFAVSYDGKSGNKTFGNELPRELNLKKIELEVGRSSQATLLGRDEITIESLYLSPSLLDDDTLNIDDHNNKIFRQVALV
jgi:DNA adenine methylase